MGERVSRPAAHLDGGYPVDDRLFQGAQRDIGGKQNRAQGVEEEAGDTSRQNRAMPAAVSEAVGAGDCLPKVGG